MADKKYRLKFGMSDGTEKSVEFTAPQGESGITPVVAVSDITGGHRVTITTGNNVQTVDVLDGKNGDPGKNGITPTVSVTEIEGGHRVTITTGSNVQSFDVLDGKDGEGGGTADEVAWENVTDKPFNESLTGTAVVNGDTLSWDGNLDAMPIVVTPNNYNKWIYVSDNVPTMEQISAGHTLAFKVYNGSEINIGITPSESENYIYVGDIDGQYLYIIKKPCTVGSMVFERAGIYFYSDSKATIYTCRLTINGYTFTEMDSIKDAYIPQTIARKSDIPQGGTVEVDPTLSIEGMAADAKAVGDAIKAIGSGGGAQVQSDWNQHDSTAPDYVKNRVAYPAYSQVLFSEEVWIFADEGMAFASEEEYGTLKVPSEGKRYTIETANNAYSGTAISTDMDIGGAVVPCILIEDEQGSGSSAMYLNVLGSVGWMIFSPDTILSEGAYMRISIIEGDNTYKKLSIPDDVIISLDGMNIVFEFRNLQESNNRYIAEALINDVEFVVDADGVEYVLTVDDIDVVGDADTIQSMQGAMYYLKGSDRCLAMIADMYETGESVFVILMDEKSISGSGITVKSIKVNLPGIFAPNIPAKKLPDECMPGALIAYIPSFFEAGSGFCAIYMDKNCNEPYALKRAEDLFRAGVQIYVCVCSDNTPDREVYYPVSSVELNFDADGIVSVNLYYQYKDGKLGLCGA